MLSDNIGQKRYQNHERTNINKLFCFCEYLEIILGPSLVDAILENLQVHLDRKYIIDTNQTWKKFCSLAAGCTAAPKWSLRRSQNPSPTKNALKIHHFKGSRKLRMRAAGKPFSWPDKNSLRIYTNSQPFFHWLSLSMLMTPNRIGYNFYEYTVHNCTMRKFH